MRGSRQQIARKSRTALGWALSCFVALQAALSIDMDRWQPELRDPEYGYKLMRLRERLAEDQGRPLMLVIGSSRAGLGFCPEVFSEYLNAHKDAPIVFNYAMTGSGPLMELLCLRRLLAEGIRPKAVVIEVLSPILHQEQAFGESQWLDINRLGSRDLPFVKQYTDHVWWRYRRWVRSRMVPWSSHRFCVMSRYLPEWLPFDARQDGWRGMDRSGWLPYPKEVVNEEQYATAREFARKQYFPALFDFHVSEAPNRAMHEILEICRRERIAPMLLLMPEGTEFRSWYPPAALAEIDSYVADLSREYQAPVIDARLWLADSAFFDSHHLLPSGARQFSGRFDREVLQPTLEGKAVAGRSGGNTGVAH